MTFQQLLILADQDGVVDMTAAAIARRTTIPIDIITRGIAALMEPDPESRTPDEGGRRLVPLADGRSWGWRIVNYVKYRQIKREEDRREYHREYWHKRKLKDSTATQQTQPNQPIAEAEAEAEAEAGKELMPRKSAKSAAVASAQRKSRGTRLPDEWALPKPWGEWAIGEMSGWTVDTVRNEAAKFADFWHAKTGKDATKADWFATWRNWCRNAKHTTLQRNGRNPMSKDQRDEEAMRLLGFSTAFGADVIEVGQ